MEATAAARSETKETPKAQKFSLKTPYMKQGRITQTVAQTDNMWIAVKINAEGGENEIHTHLNQDHAFIVLEGEMSVFDEKGNEMKLKPYQGVMLPKGAYYRYLNTGEGNLVVLRVAAYTPDRPPKSQAARVMPDGTPIAGGSVENKSLPPIEMPGKFFAESAG
ncbi:MAG TPA: cupin domain-containing protein [Candidatus Acidoferrales bacterium]|nr:cupin domain-containing protein [Candidatus Acidoferrales bacterium]